MPERLRRPPGWAAGVEPADLEGGRWDYLILSSRAWGAYFDPRAWTRPQHSLHYRRYRELQEALEPVAEFAPSWDRAGPLLTVYRLQGADTAFRTAQRFLPRDATHANHEHLATPDGGPIRFSRRGQAVVFKDYFAPGRYRISLRTRPRSIRSWVHVATVDAREIATLALPGSGQVELPAADKYLFRVFLAAGCALHRVSVERIGTTP